MTKSMIILLYPVQKLSLLGSRNLVNWAQETKTSAKQSLLGSAWWTRNGVNWAQETKTTAKQSLLGSAW